MNILLINQYAGSLQHGMEYRPYYLSREWVRDGHQVTIIAASYSHLRTRNPSLNQNKIVEITIEGIRYLWLKTPSYQGNGIRRAINIFTFVTRLILYSRNVIHDLAPDLIITSSTHPLDNFPAFSWARKLDATLVYEVHDLWPLSLIELGGMSKFHPFTLLIQAAEKFAYKNAHFVVSLLPKAASHMQAHGMHPSKFVYIPNGVDISEWA